LGTVIWAGTLIQGAKTVASNTTGRKLFHPWPVYRHATHFFIQRLFFKLEIPFVTGAGLGLSLPGAYLCWTGGASAR